MVSARAGTGVAPDEWTCSQGTHFAEIFAPSAADVVSKRDCRRSDMNTDLEHIVADLRHAARLLRRARGFTVTAVAVLALTIGANTAVFSVVNGLLLRALPYPDA